MPNNFLSWFWWFFTAIVTALIVNLGAGYLKPKIDSLWGKYSENQREKNENKINSINKIVEEILSDPTEANYAHLRLIEELIIFGIVLLAQLFLLSFSLQSLLSLSSSPYSSEIITIDSFVKAFNQNSTFALTVSSTIIYIILSIVFGILFWVRYQNLIYHQHIFKVYRSRIIPKNHKKKVANYR